MAESTWAACLLGNPVLYPDHYPDTGTVYLRYQNLSWVIWSQVDTSERVCSHMALTCIFTCTSKCDLWAHFTHLFHMQIYRYTSSSIKYQMYCFFSCTEPCIGARENNNILPKCWLQPVISNFNICCTNKNFLQPTQKTSVTLVVLKVSDTSLDFCSFLANYVSNLYNILRWCKQMCIYRKKKRRLTLYLETVQINEV